MCPLNRGGSDPAARPAIVARAEQTEVTDVEDDVNRPVANVVDAIEVGAKLLDVGFQPRHVAERLVEIGEQRLKGDQNTDAQGAVNDFSTAQAEDRDRGQAGEGRGRASKRLFQNPRTCSALIIRA